MTISSRLKLIAEMVKTPTVADIGTDHGHLPIYLVKSGKVIRALAADINPGPLDGAKKNISHWELEDFVETRLCDGLCGINPEEYTTCVIAGMGGLLIMDILRKNLPQAQGFKQLLLSPQRDVRALRVFLHKNNFRITDEELIAEHGKYYNILDAAKGHEPAYDEKGYMFGRKLIEKRSPALKQMVAAEIFKTNSILTGLNGHNVRKAELELYLQHCKEVLACLHAI